MRMVRGTTHSNGAPMRAEADSTGRARFEVSGLLVRLVVGFGLFKAVIDQAYSSAMSTAHGAYPIINSVEFSIAASFWIIAACVAVGLVAWRRPATSLRVPGIACTALLLIANCASALGLLAWMPAGGGGAALAAVYAAAAVVSNAAWLLPIAYLPARGCLGTLACSYLLAKVVSWACAALPDAWSASALLAVGMASVVLFCTVRDPRTAADVLIGSLPTPRLAVRRVAVELAGPLVVFVALNLVLGLIMAFQAADAQSVEGTSFLKAVASVAANLLLLGIAVFAKGMPNIRRAFGMLFPVVALLLIALPFLGPVYGAAFGALLMFLQGVVSTTVLFMLLEAAKRVGVPVIAAVAAISLVSRVFVLLGLLVGGMLGTDVRLDDTVRTLVMVVVALYLLALVLVWLLRGRSTRLTGETAPGLGLGELSTFDEFDGVGEGPGKDSPSGFENVGNAVRDPADLLGAHAPELAEAHRLTSREAEVALLLARGRSAGYIAETLGISQHTVRGYIKDAYVKLGVHSKQELIDLYTG